MKKIMWIVAVIPTIVTFVVLRFMPDVIPMHHDIAGNTDRWGSKFESYIFPIIIIVVTVFWYFLIRYYEKKAMNEKEEKKQMEAKSSAKFLNIIGISQAAMFGIMHYFILYSSYVQADTGETKATVDIAKISCLLLGILLVILGNFMPKARKNYSAGVRTSYSMYNDVTWRKSNRFGAICIIVAGILTVITSAFANGTVSVVCFLVYIITATVATAIYSKKVYDEEVAKDNKSI